MASVNLPLTYTALASPELNTPAVAIQKTVTSLAADELLVRLSYASLNPMDSKLQQVNFWHFPLPLVLGFDFSGTVVAVGGGSGGDGSIAVGAEVFGYSPPARYYAEYLVVQRQFVCLRGPIPVDEASTYGIAYNSAAESLLLSDDLSSAAVSGST